MKTVYNHIFLVLLEVIIMFGFLTIFFFTYVSKVEAEQVKKQISGVVNDIMEELNVLLDTLPENQQVSLKQELLKKIDEKLAALPPTRKSNPENQRIQGKGFRYLTIFFIVLVFVGIIMSTLKVQYKWETILHYGVLAVLVAGLVEFCFLQFIASRYVSLDGNEVLKLMGQKIQELSK